MGCILYSRDFSPGSTVTQRTSCSPSSLVLSQEPPKGARPIWNLGPALQKAGALTLPYLNLTTPHPLSYTLPQQDGLSLYCYLWLALCITNIERRQKFLSLTSQRERPNFCLWQEFSPSHLRIFGTRTSIQWGRGGGEGGGGGGRGGGEGGSSLFFTLLYRSSFL